MGLMSDQESNVANYGGGYGMGGSWLAIILVVVVLWLLFKDGFHGGHNNYAYDGNAYGYGHGRCGVCVEDESNWELDRHTVKEVCEVDKDVLKEGCKDREAVVCDGEKTRALMVHLQERNEDKAYQALLYDGMKKDNIIQTLQLEKNFDGKIAGIYNEVEKGFCKTNMHIEKFECETPKRPPFWGQGFVPDGERVPLRHEFRHERFDNCGCGCNERF